MPDNKGQGMNWIRLPKRLAIYHRDGFDCVWCRGVFPLDPLGYGLTLDHIDGTLHDACNLVTACNTCNVRRAQTPLEEWLLQLRREGHRGVRSRLKLTQPLDMEAGKYLAHLRKQRAFSCNYWRPRVD